MALRVYNTLTRQKEPFQTVQPGKVGMYVCGPTVYKPSHIGHMVGPVIFDTVRRYLTYLGYEVTFIVNITDVDDKLIKRAQELGTTVKALAEQMTADYRDCLRQLGVEGITHLPKATEHIQDMVRLIQGLIDKGHAYAAGGDVYFNVLSDPDYGKLCHRDPEQMEAGSRIEVSEKKRNPGDFALWKGSKPGEPAWESPWGPGRPGWHIECSAMSMRYLGQTFDIHGGGDDLKFPHHENELAQSESFTGQPFVRYWMHNGLLKMGKAKMAGSIGNVVNMVDLLKQFDAETVRFLLLSTHYRSPIEYSEERLKEVRRSLEAFYRFFERYQRITGRSFYDVRAYPSIKEELEKARVRPAQNASGAVQAEAGLPEPTGDVWPNSSFHRPGRRRLGAEFLDYMDEDFNTGGAISVLFGLVTHLNRLADEENLEGGSALPAAYEEFVRGVEYLREFSQILGLFREPPAAAAGAQDELVAGLVELLIDLRADARKAKNFALADQIRQRLGQLGVTLEDRPGDTGWRRG